MPLDLSKSIRDLCNHILLGLHPIRKASYNHRNRFWMLVEIHMQDRARSRIYRCLSEYSNIFAPHNLGSCQSLNIQGLAGDRYVHLPGVRTHTFQNYQYSSPRGIHNPIQILSGTPDLYSHICSSHDLTCNASGSHRSRLSMLIDVHIRDWFRSHIFHPRNEYNNPFAEHIQWHPCRSLNNRGLPGRHVGSTDHFPRNIQNPDCTPIRSGTTRNGLSLHGCHYVHHACIRHYLCSKIDGNCTAPSLDRNMLDHGQVRKNSPPLRQNSSSLACRIHSEEAQNNRFARIYCPYRPKGIHLLGHNPTCLSMNCSPYHFR